MPVWTGAAGIFRRSSLVFQETDANRGCRGTALAARHGKIISTTTGEATMPNWILNRVKVTGTPRRITKVKRTILTFDDSELHELEDKLAGRKPMPEYETAESVRRSLDFIRSQGSSYFTNHFDFNKIIPMPAHGDTFFATGPLGEEERKKYGKNNWYDWSVEHWGTKWNSSESSLYDEDEDCLEYTFRTAWSAPGPVIAALAKKFKVSVVCDYYDTDNFPNTAGRIVAKPDGDVSFERHSEDLDWFASAFGSDLPAEYGYQLVNGKWEYIEG